MCNNVVVAELEARVGIGQISPPLQIKYAWFHWGIKQKRFYPNVSFLIRLVSVLVSALWTRPKRDLVTCPVTCPATCPVGSRFRSRGEKPDASKSWLIIIRCVVDYTPWFVNKSPNISSKLWRTQLIDAFHEVADDAKNFVEGGHFSWAQQPSLLRHFYKMYPDGNKWIRLVKKRLVGIQVAEHRLVPVGNQSIAVITRFDRAGKNVSLFISKLGKFSWGEDPTPAMSQYNRSRFWLNDLCWFRLSFYVENSDAFLQQKNTLAQL
jgi:hypothetical protein